MVVHLNPIRKVKLSDLGSLLAILTFVFVQFVEYCLFKIGTFDVSIQKITALIIFPVACIFMQRLRISLFFIIFGLSLILVNSMAYIAKSEILHPNLLSANLTILLGFIGSIVLYTSLTHDRNSFSQLAYIWIAFSIVTSILAFLQMIGMAPLYTVPNEHLPSRLATEGLYRGVGLKFDPNFQALMLGIGVVFTKFYAQKTTKLIMLSVILIGILATFSRMGLLAAATSLIIAPIALAWPTRRKLIFAFVKALAIIMILIGFIAAAYILSPQIFKSYYKQRTIETLKIFNRFEKYALTTEDHLTSTEERILSSQTSLQLAIKNIPFGVGAYQTNQAIYKAVGIETVAHDTFLELFLTGGLWGLLPITIYVFALTYALTGRHSKKNQFDRSLIITLIFYFSFIACFLSLNYNSVLWMPIVIALAHKRQTHLFKSPT